MFSARLRFDACILVFFCTALLLFASQQRSCYAAVSAPFQIRTYAKNIIVWQQFGSWLMITEDLPDGRICYYYDHTVPTRLDLKEPQPGEWIPLGSAIKWLMFIDHHQGLDRLMAHDVDWHAYYIAWPAAQDQVGCGMRNTKCIFGQYRPMMVGDHYPVDLYHFNVQTGACDPFCVSDSEKSQFAHDAELIVYRSYNGPGQTAIFGHYFDGASEFQIAPVDGLYPAVCGNLVAWAQTSDDGYDIVAKDILTGETRTVAHTTADPPRPQVGQGTVFWQDARNLETTGLDIYGYEWSTQNEFAVTDAPGDQMRVRACSDIVTWVSGLTNYQTLWGAYIAPTQCVDDLAVSLVTQDSVELSWTSVGTAENPPLCYDLRTRPDQPITDSNWSSSTAIPGLPVPQQPGQQEIYAVQPLDRGHHHFALKVTFQSGIISPISNSVCAYVSSQSGALNADIGAYTTFAGTVTGATDDGTFFCQEASGFAAIRAVSETQLPPATNTDVLVTGTLAECPELFGPVLDRAVFVDLGPAASAKPMAMQNSWVGGLHPRFGGTQQGNAPNMWVLVKTWGWVSDLIVDDSGCTFCLSDGSSIPDNAGRGVLVICPYTPAQLENGVFATVEGISCVSRTTGRQLRVVDSQAIRIWLQ